MLTGMNNFEDSWTLLFLFWQLMLTFIEKCCWEFLFFSQNKFTFSKLTKRGLGTRTLSDLLKWITWNVSQYGVVCGVDCWTWTMEIHGQIPVELWNVLGDWSSHPVSEKLISQDCCEDKRRRSHRHSPEQLGRKCGIPKWIVMCEEKKQFCLEEYLNLII